tara:strand:+ start:629 stop:802 length:174 start_codon:yes stop_codon:yes gene_type:complete
MLELQNSVESYPAWKAILWCFYPIGSIILIGFISNIFNDDDDQDGGKMIPVFQAANS